MADNASLTVGDGTLVAAADDISGVKYPRVKLIIGADGVNDGDISAANPLPVTGDVDVTGSTVAITGTVTVGSHAVTNAGTFAVQAAQSGAWNVTNISGTVSLPTGASIAAKQPALGTAGTASADVISVQGIASMTPLLATVTGNLTNISGTISLPTGAATAAKQPALGTAGTASADVISVQGIASMTPLLATVTGNLTNISGTISLPTGASTAAKQPALGTAGTASADVISVQGIASMTPLLATVTGNITTVTTVTTITNDVKVIGDTAADAALTVAPVTVGARAANANPTNMSAAGDVVNLQADLGGRLVTIDAPRELMGRTNTSLSNTTSETTIIAATASTFHDVHGLILANTGATATEVSIRDDTGGTVMATFYVPAGETRGFMVPASSATPQTAVNKNWTAQCASATTAMKITALYVSRI